MSIKYSYHKKIKSSMHVVAFYNIEKCSRISAETRNNIELIIKCNHLIEFFPYKCFIQKYSIIALHIKSHEMNDQRGFLNYSIRNPQIKTASDY